MRICADACFLIGLYDETDQYHAQARNCFVEHIEKGRNMLLLPWPIMYGSVSTRMARSERRMRAIDRHLRTLRVNRQVEFIDDSCYRIEALAECFPDSPNRRYRPLSLADVVIRKMLMHGELRVNALATFNVGDFRCMREAWKTNHPTITDC